MKRLLLITILALTPLLGFGASSDQTKNSAAYVASYVIKTGPGVLFMLSGYNSKASAQFIQLHDAISLPANGAAPVMTFTVPATSNFSVAIPVSGMPFVTGIVVANSSTGPTLTVGSADVYFTASFGQGR